MTCHVPGLLYSIVYVLTANHLPTIPTSDGVDHPFCEAVSGLSTQLAAGNDSSIRLCLVLLDSSRHLQLPSYGGETNPGLEVKCRWSCNTGYDQAARRSHEKRKDRTEIRGLKPSPDGFHILSS
jgi:hypothetical protein